LKRDDANDNYISETITTLVTTYVPFGSVIIAIDESENRTRLSLTVSEIFDRKHIALNGERDISLFFFFFFFFFYLSAKSLCTYLLLQEWSDPGNFDSISMLWIRRREFLILAGKFQLVDSP
jgi:hypothetical protein